MSFADFLYMAALVPVAPFLGYKLLTDSRYRHALPERLGFVPKIPGAIWIHGSSVGEAQAARTLAQGLFERFPGRPLVISTLTRTGRKSVEGSSFLRGVFYAPFDFAVFVSRAFDRLRPAAIILVEQELWPNWLREAARRDVPVVLASARLTENSVKDRRLLPRLWNGALEAIQVALAQDDMQARRLMRLGIPPNRVRVAGNVKFDSRLDSLSSTDVERWKGEMGIPKDVPVLVAGSTHEGEEQVVLEGFRRLRQEFKELRLILAPRHPERFEGVARWLESQGVRWNRRSHHGVNTEEVLLLDTVGELKWVYGLADFVFVGGTLVPRGGHSLLEPANHGKAMLVGPSLFNVAEVAEGLRQSGCLWVIEDPSGFAEKGRELLRDEGMRRQAGERARECVGCGKGALARHVDAIEEVLIEREAGSNLKYLPQRHGEHGDAKTQRRSHRKPLVT